jgi:DNA-binding IclR family transcriptional regulator
LHLGASNTVLLAFIPEQERMAIIQHTVPDADARAAVEQEMTTITAQGYAYSASQLTAGVAALGVPLLDPEGQVIAALSIGAPEYRFTLERALTMLPKLQEAALTLYEGFAKSTVPTLGTAARAAMAEGGAP